MKSFAITFLSNRKTWNYLYRHIKKKKEWEALEQRDEQYHKRNTLFKYTRIKRARYNDGAFTQYATECNDTTKESDNDPKQKTSDNRDKNKRKTRYKKPTITK